MKWTFQILLAALLTGCATSKPPATVRIHEEVSRSLPPEYLQWVTLAATNQRLPVNPHPTLTEKEIAGAITQPGPGGLAVQLQFDLHGANLLTEMTLRLRDRSFVVFVNGKPVAAVMIEHPITDGKLRLFPDMTEAEIKSLVASLNEVANRPRDRGDVRLMP